MADKQISILLIAKDLASKTIGKVNKQIGTLGTAAGRAGQGMRTLAGNLAKLGAIAAVGIGVAVKNGIESLALLESAVASVDGAISQMGLTGKVTGAAVATWANEIEASVGAAFDDKDITSATATLLRFGKVTPANLRPAMVVMTDLAVKTGDVDSAASLLAKALADPTKAAGKLARQGVILTKAEQDQIAAFMKAGKVAEAQKVILDSLAKTTAGAAAASQGPYARAMSTLADVTEDAQRAIAEGFLPVLERVAKWLSTSLADPRVMADIRSLGQTMAGAFDQAVSFAQKVPWGSVMSAMKALGTGAKMALDAFTAMPSWVQTAVIGGWGLNKLTGGALTDILGGALKSVIPKMAIAAGIVNVNGPVTGTPGGKGGPAIPGGAAAGGGVVTAVLAPAAVTAIAGAVAVGLYQVIPRLLPTKPETGVDPSARNTTNMWGRQVAALTANLPTIAQNTEPITGSVNSLATMSQAEAAMSRAATAQAASRTTMATAVGAARTVGATMMGAGIVAGAVRASRPIVTTDVRVYVTAASVTKSTTTHTRYGTTGGSAGSGGPGGRRYD